jgi:hypothetical protein
MNATTRGVVALLTCIACASAAAAQDSDTRIKQQEKRETIRRLQSETKADVSRQRQTVQRRGAARGIEQEATESFTRTVRLERGGTFDLQNAAGDVTITGSGGREARIEAVKRVRSRAAGPQARTALNQIRIDVAERGGNVEVRTTRPRGPVLTSVDYVITLPEDANLVLQSTSGNFYVEKMSGDELSARTLRGNLTMNEIRNRLLELHTVIGNISLRDITTQRAQLESTEGNLEFAGVLRRTGRYRLQTHNGDIRVIPSGEPGFDLEAMTYRGDLRSDFVLKLFQPPAGRTAAGRPLPAPRPVQKVLRGTYGDAGAALTVMSFSGNVFIGKPQASEGPQP